MGSVSPFFFALEQARVSKTVQAAIEETVEGLGYELVDTESAAGGVLRVFIDVRPGSAAPVSPLSDDAQAGPDDQGVQPAAERITLDDCERVSRQLIRVLEVEGIDYARLEVSSPGLDRPLKKPGDFERFAGRKITLRLKQPVEGRRNFEGPFEALGDGRYQLEFQGKSGPSLLSFVFDDVDKARLVPKIEF